MKKAVILLLLLGLALAAEFIPAVREPLLFVLVMLLAIPFAAPFLS